MSIKNIEYKITTVEGIKSSPRKDPRGMTHITSLREWADLTKYKDIHEQISYSFRKWFSTDSTVEDIQSFLEYRGWELLNNIFNLDNFSDCIRVIMHDGNSVYFVKAIHSAPLIMNNPDIDIKLTTLMWKDNYCANYTCWSPSLNVTAYTEYFDKQENTLVDAHRKFRNIALRQLKQGLNKPESKFYKHWNFRVLKSKKNASKNTEVITHKLPDGSHKYIVNNCSIISNTGVVDFYK